MCQALVPEALTVLIFQVQLLVQCLTLDLIEIYMYLVSLPKMEHTKGFSPVWRR